MVSNRVRPTGEIEEAQQLDFARNQRVKNIFLGPFGQKIDDVLELLTRTSDGVIALAAHWLTLGEQLESQGCGCPPIQDKSWGTLGHLGAVTNRVLRIDICRKGWGPDCRRLCSDRLTAASAPLQQSRLHSIGSIVGTYLRNNSTARRALPTKPVT